MSDLSRDFYDDLEAAEFGYQGAQAATSDRVAADFDRAYELITTPTEDWPFDCTPADIDTQWETR